MTKEIDTSKEMQEIQDSQASLVTALESIKSLLAESESKLSTARETLSGNHPSDETSPFKRTKIDVPIVPVLDDIVFAETDHTKLTEYKYNSEEQTTETEKEQMPEASAFFDDILPEKPQTDISESSSKSIPTANPELDILNTNTLNEQFKEELLQTVDRVQSDLETEIEQIITLTVTNLEIQLRNLIAEKLQNLRKDIESQNN